MKPKYRSRFLTKRLTPILALAALANLSHAATFTWDGDVSGTGTNMDTAANWSGDTVPNGTNGDIAQWDGSVAENLVLTYTALTSGANLGAGNGISLNILGSQTDSLTINESGAGSGSLRIVDITVASGAGALTFGGTAGTDTINLGSGSATTHTWTNHSSNAVSFSSDVSFGAGGGATHALTLTGTGNWNVNTSLIKNATGIINVIKDGAGTMNLGTANSLGNAAFTIKAGTLNNTSGAALTLTNTTQTWNGDFAYGTAAGTSANDLSLGSGTVSLGTAAGTSRTISTHGAGVLMAAGVISNGTTANSIIKSGTGGLRLDGNNTYSGGTTLNEGTLHVGHNSALGTGTLAINGGTITARLASRTLANAVTVGGDFTLSATGINNQITFSGTMDLGGATRTINVFDTTQATDAAFTNIISNGALTKAGAGTMVLSGANTYAGGTTVTGGKLSFANGSLGTTGNISMNGGTLQWNGTNTQDISSRIVMNAGKTATFDTNGNDVTFASAIGSSTTGSLVKTGTGALTLATGVTHTYTGDTTVSGGKLVINGNISTSLLTTVENGASLGGSGTLGALTVNAGGSLAPGDSPGNLTVAGDLTLAGTYIWELAALSTDNPGNDFDTITMTVGNTNLTDSLLSLSLGSLAPSAAAFWQADQTWIGILNNTGSGSLTGMFAAIDNSAWASLGTFSTVADGNDVNLVWTAVPEPGAAMLGSLGVLALLRRRR